jgi:hypothetical protein
MTIPQLRQEAKDLRDLANRFLLYGEKHSLDAETSSQLLGTPSSVKPLARLPKTSGTCLNSSVIRRHASPGRVEEWRHAS